MLRAEVEAFLSSLQAGFSDNTILAYQNDLNQLVRFVQAKLGGSDTLQWSQVKLPAYKAGHLIGESIEGGWRPPSPPQIGLPFIPVHRTGHPGKSSEPRFDDELHT